MSDDVAILLISIIAAQGRITKWKQFEMVWCELCLVFELSLMSIYIYILKSYRQSDEEISPR